MDTESWIQTVLSICAVVIIADGSSVFSMLPLDPVSPLYPYEMDCPNPDETIAEIFLSSHQITLGIPDRALRTLPEKWFTVAISTVPEADLGVFTTTFIKANTWLGEFEGLVITVAEKDSYDYFDHSYLWRTTKQGEITYYIDAQDVTISNWIRYFNAPAHSSKVNLDYTYCFGKIFLRTARDMAPGTELFLDYGPDYMLYNLGYDLDEYYGRI